MRIDSATRRRQSGLATAVRSSPKSSGKRGGPVETGGTATLVWRQVLRAIYDGRYAPGQRLTEAELTAEFAVSRSSVREALSRLAAEGAVKLERHKGAIVRVATKTEMLQILAVLDALIGLAARLAAENIAREGARELAEETLRRLAAPKKTRSRFDVARERNGFYRTLMRLADNPELSRIMSQVHVHPLRLQMPAGRPTAAIFADYLGILAAILAADPQRAEMTAKAHVAANVSEIRSLPDEVEAEG